MPDTPSPAKVAADLVRLLDLQKIDPSPASPAAVAAYRGGTAPAPRGHVFGGQVMGQAVVATGRTVPEGRHIHSMYSYFLAPGRTDVPIDFTVDALRDGGSFSVRRVLASQGEETIFAMTASFQKRQDGFEHEVTAPPAPDPEGLPTTADVLAGIEHPVARFWSEQRPIDIRHVTDPIYVRPDSSGSDAQLVWMRTIAPITAPPLVHDAVLAFASDYTPFEPILRRHGLTWTTPGLRMATVNHAIWWHRHVDADQWLLYEQTSPSASGGRGLTTGRMFDREGALVATVTQEGMIRQKRV